MPIWSNTGPDSAQAGKHIAEITDRKGLLVFGHQDVLTRLDEIPGIVRLTGAMVFHIKASLDRWQDEDRFRPSKNDDLVGVQPIRHWTDDKIRYHLLHDILMIALCAVISGADSWSQVDIALYFKDPDKNHTDFFQTIDGEHGRIETWSYTTTSDINWFQEKHLWAGLKTICKVTCLRDVRGSLPGSKRSLS
jgi:hypothetical protein